MITFKPTKEKRFVINLHNAKKAGLHYDIRIEMQRLNTNKNVLISWTTKKLEDLLNNKVSNIGIIQVDDHPLSFLTFEGNISDKEYGSGKISIWDKGTFEVIKIKDNVMTLNFNGNKIIGPYAFVYLNNKENKKLWLLVKVKNKYKKLLAQ